MIPKVTHRHCTVQAYQKDVKTTSNLSTTCQNDVHKLLRCLNFAVALSVGLLNRLTRIVPALSRSFSLSLSITHLLAHPPTHPRKHALTRSLTFCFFLSICLSVCLSVFLIVSLFFLFLSLSLSLSLARSSSVPLFPLSLLHYKPHTSKHTCLRRLFTKHAARATSLPSELPVSTPVPFMPRS